MSNFSTQVSATVPNLLPTLTGGFSNNLGPTTPLAARSQSWETPIEAIQVKENEFIFKEGEAPKGLYYVKSGSVKVVYNRLTTRGRTATPEFITKVAGPGEIFGYQEMVQSENFYHFAKSLKASEIHIYSRPHIERMMRDSGPILKSLLNQAVKDVQANEKISQLHYLASVQERIAYQLLFLADKFGVVSPRGIHLALKLTRNELAQLASTINESLSRHLTEFKNEGILELNGREIIVKDRQALINRAGHFNSHPF